MKMKRICKKIIARVLTAVMLVSVFSTVDMGWNVSKVQAADTDITIDTRGLSINDRLIYPITTITASKSIFIDGKTARFEIASVNATYGQSGFMYYGDRFYPYGEMDGLQVGVYELPAEYSVTRIDITNDSNITYTYNASSVYLRTPDDEAGVYLGSEEEYTVGIKAVTVRLHKCTSGTKVAGTAAKCNAYGVKDAYKCSSCGKYYSDSAYKTRIANNDDEYNTWKSNGGRIAMVSHNDVYSSVNPSTRTITYKCDKGCNRTTTYTLNPNGCTGEIPYVNRSSYTVPTVTKSGQASAEPTVNYKGVSDTSYGPNITRPTASGSYQAYITMGSGTVYCNFSIAPGGDIYKFKKGDDFATGNMSDQLVLESEWKDGETQLNPNEFSKTGYSFDKWKSDSSNSDYQFFEDKAKVRHPDLTAPWTLTLTAQWKANDYTVTFDNNGADKSQGIQSETVTYDKQIPSIGTSDLPQKNCSIFLGYFTEKIVGEQVYNADGTPVITKWITPNDTTLYAHWDINHNWGYEAKDNRVIATCKKCDFSQVLTLTAPDDVYNKQSFYNGADVTNDDEFPKKMGKDDIQYEGKLSTGVDYVKSSDAPQNAGTYTATVTVKVDEKTDYIAKQNFIIDKATQDNVTVSVPTYTWGDSVPNPTTTGIEEKTQADPVFYYNDKNSNEGGTLWTKLEGNTLDSGTAYVYAVLTETDNYYGCVTEPFPFTINGLTFDSHITAESYNGMYNKQPQTIEFSVEDTDPTLKIYYATSDNGSYSEEKPTFTKAGEYTVYYKVKKFGYQIEAGFETVTITKAPITISGIAAKDKVYNGDTAASFDYSNVNYGSNYVEGDQLSVTAVGNFDNKNVGEDKVVTISAYALSGADEGNYKLVPLEQQQTASSANITQKEIELSWENLSFDYDTYAHQPTATVGNLATNDKCSVTVGLVGVDQAINAGNYTANASGLTGDDSKNYKLPANTAKAFTINKANQSGTLAMVGYGYSGPVETPNVTGYYENPSITYYYSLENKTTGGTLWKNIEPEALEPDTYYMYAVLAATQNYKAYTTTAVQFIVNGTDISTDVSSQESDNTYTGVSNHKITVTAPKDATIKYGLTDGSYTLSENPTFKDVNTYTVYYKVTQKGCNPVKGSNTVKINKATLHVTPDADQTKVYGEDDPVFTYTVKSDELLGTDKASVVSGSIQRISGETVGDYVFSDKDLTAANYTVLCDTGVMFKITPRDISEDMVTLKTRKFGYTGADIDVAGGNITVRYNGKILTENTDYTISDNTATTKGTHFVTITGIGNFKGTVKKEWMITDPTVTGITAVDVTKTYDGNEYTITVGGTSSGDIVTYGISENSIEETSAISYKDAGTYTIWYKVNRPGSNREPFESSATLTINPKEVDVDWEAGGISLVYNGEKQTPAATVNGLVLGDNCQVETTSDSKDVGNRTATAIALSNPNYKLIASPSTKPFTITPKPITVKAKNVSKYVNAADPELTYEADGLCAGDILSGITLTRAAGESVGTYTITVSVQDGVNSNYSITPQNGTFVISSRPVPNNKPSGNGSDDSDNSDDSGNPNPTTPDAPFPKKDVPEEKKPSDGLPKLTEKDTTKKDGDKQDADKDLTSSDKPGDGKDTNGDDGLKKNEDVKEDPVAENDKIKYGDGNINIVIDKDVQPGIGGTNPGTPEETLNVKVKSLEELVDAVLTDEEKERVKNGEEVTIRVVAEETIISEEDKATIDTYIENEKVIYKLEDGNTVEVGMTYGKSLDVKVLKKIGNGKEVEVTDWNGKITVTVDIPKDLIADGRNYYVIAYVDGEVKRIEVTVNDDNTITFAAEEHVEYAICYIDESEIPLSVLSLHRHHFLWLYLILLLLFFGARAITKEKTNAVKISLFAGDVVAAGLLLFVVKICLLSVIVCLAEIAVATVIHLLIKSKNQTANAN